MLNIQQLEGVERSDEIDFNSQQEVEVDTLDSLVKKTDHIRLLKIDVEGFEAKVLKGGKNIIKNYQLDYILLEAILEISGHKAHKELMDFLYYMVTELNYDLCEVDRNGLCVQMDVSVLLYSTSGYFVLRSPHATNH